MIINEEIYLETREDLCNLLKKNEYKYIILKFKASWCKPCKTLEPFVNNLIKEKIKELNSKQKTNIFLYVEVDIDECNDLYSFLKSKKRLNGVPSILLYENSIISNVEDEYKYIPQKTISGIKENEIKKLFECIQ
tara:strand:+ start:145 stop:549 length:405 start_codon:yes stop_codon:yes gene_type:complete